MALSERTQEVLKMAGEHQISFDVVFQLGEKLGDPVGELEEAIQEGKRKSSRTGRVHQVNQEE